MTPLTDTELTALAAEVDAQLNALETSTQTFGPSRGTEPAKPVSATTRPQQAVIEQATGENFETFWQKFRRHAHRDLCLPGGVLHDHWQKWKDLETKEAVKSSYLGAFAQTDKNSHRIFVRSWFCVGFSQIVAFQF